MTSRTTVQGDSVEDIRAQLLDTYGPGSKIISVEKVTKGGIGGFMAKHYYEATVLLPGHPAAHKDTGVDLRSRIGIVALLADANDTEDSFVERGPQFSTASSEFDALITELSSRNTEAPEAATPVPTASVGRAEFTAQLAPPAVATHPGDLALVVGLGQDALSVAQTMSKHLGNIDIRGGGLIKARGTESLTDRRSALLARADSVGSNKSTICAFGLDPDVDSGDVLEAINADQVWVVVDVGRKPEDTRRWVNALAGRIGAHAVAVINTRHTDTPQTVNGLGLPIGWADGAPTAAPRL